MNIPNFNIPPQQQFVNPQQFIPSPMNQAYQLPGILPAPNGAKRRRSNNSTPILIPQQQQQPMQIPNCVDSAELKKQQRIIRNRISAQLHRERKFAYISNLETQVKEKDRIISELRNQVDCLNNQIVELSNINISLQRQLEKATQNQNQIIDNPLPIITDEIISSDEGGCGGINNNVNSITSSPLTSPVDDFSSESSTGSPDIGILSDSDSSSNNNNNNNNNINSGVNSPDNDDYFNFEPNLEESDYLFFNSDNLFSSSSSSNNSHSFNQYNSIIIGLLIFTLPILLLLGGSSSYGSNSLLSSSSIGFGITKNEIITNNNNNNNNRFLVENDHYPPALPDSSTKLNPFVSNPPPDPALNSFNDKSTDMSKAISIYKHKPLNNDIYALKRWESKLHDTLKSNANDVSKQLFSKNSYNNLNGNKGKNNHLRHGNNNNNNNNNQRNNNSDERKYNSSYVMCPNAFGKMLLYDGSYITDDIVNNLDINNNTNCFNQQQEIDNEKPFLLLLIPRHHIQLEGNYSESENDKVEWVEVSCNVVRSRVIRNFAM